MALEIDVRELKRATIVAVKGRVDSSNSAELEKTFENLMDEGTFRIVVDCQGLEYISSAGLHVLVSTLKACRRYNRGDLRLCNLSDRISEVLDLAGLVPLFEIFDDAVGAVGSF